MASRDLLNTILSKQSIAPGARTATVTGTGVDLKGYHSAVVVVGAGAWTDGTHTFSIEESDDDSSYAAVAAGSLQGAAPVISSGGGANQVYEVGYLGAKRYVRVKSTVTGSPATGALYDATVVLGHPSKVPTR